MQNVYSKDFMLHDLRGIHKRRQNFLAVFDTLLRRVGILTLIYLTSTF